MNAAAQSRARRDVADLAAAKRIVIKIGSAILADPARGTIRRQWLEALAEDIAVCHGRGQQVVIVSSGAIAVGRRHLGFADGELRLEEKQAAAATGMVRLAHAYQECLAVHDLTIAQILLTLDDSENRRRYLNARSTLETLFRLGAIPLINENDTVATDEIRFGDNDRLAARVAAMVMADTLVLLSDIDGLYTSDPRRDPMATLVPEIRDITSEIERMAGATDSQVGSGGMVTKLAAAKTCMAAGCRMAITNGTELHPLQRLQDGARASWFIPAASPGTARKRWIAGTLQPVGCLVVDGGAVKALRAGKSLLPAGVVAVEGRFQRGDPVAIKGPDGREVGRGLSAYSSKDGQRILGHKSGETEALLGYRGRDEMIHRDDLVLS